MMPDDATRADKDAGRCEPIRRDTKGRLRHGNPSGDPTTAPKCGAKTRSGAPCRGPAVRGKRRCRMHGGNNPGPPKGSQNALKHGLRSAAAVAARKARVAEYRQAMRDLAEVQAYLERLNGR